MNKEAIAKFEKDPIPKLIFNNALPAVISMIMVLTYNLADTFIIAQTDNPFIIAAASLATPVFLVFMSVGMIFGVGGTSLISRWLGMGHAEDAKHASAFAYWTAQVLGLFGMVSIWIFINPILRMLSASPETAGYVTQYLSVIALAVPFLVPNNVFSNILRAEGQAKKAMNGMIIGNAVNIVLSYIMVVIWGWGITGAAIGTVIGNASAFAYYLSYFLFSKSILSIKLENFRLGNGITTGILSIGIPASLNSFLMSVSVIILNNFITKFGDLAIAGMGVASKLLMMLAMVLIGFGSGVQPLFGYFFGSKSKIRFMKTLKYSLGIAILTSLVMTAIVGFGSSFMVHGFLTDATAIQFGDQFVKILVFSGPVLGVLFVFNNALQGMGAAMPAFILSISRQGLIYLPILFVFDKYFHSLNSLIAAQPVADYSASILSAILFIYAYRNSLGRSETNTNAKPKAAFSFDQ